MRNSVSQPLAARCTRHSRSTAARNRWRPSFNNSSPAAVSLARWNGTAWSAVGGGANGVVYSLKAWNDGAGPALFVGGAFTSVGGSLTVNNIARWNGSAWSALGTGANSRVRALEVFNDGSGSALYAGGLFSIAGGTSASHVARWNGSAWSAPGGTFSGSSEVLALRGHDDGSAPALYAGGTFSTLDGATANNIVRWTGCTSPSSNIPVLSGWSVAVLAMLFLTGGAAILGRRRSATVRR